MQVKRRLHINIIVLVIMTAMASLMIAVTLVRVVRARGESKIADEIAVSAFERNIFGTDYLRTGSERSRAQWITKSDQINALLKSASDTFNPDDRKTIDNLTSSNQAITNLFYGIVENRETSGSDPESVARAHETEDRLVRLLTSRLYDYLLNVRTLSNATAGRLSSTMTFAGLGIIGLLAVVTIAAAINSWTLVRTIGKRIAKLSRGAAIIGEGNLDYRIDIQGRDEFAGLAATFNVMAGKLRDSYRELETEIAERKRAEESIRRQNIILDGIGRILSAALTSPTEEDLGRVCLAIAEQVTRSKFGFIGEVGPDGMLHDIVISDPGWELCTMCDKKGHRGPPGDFKLHGLYGRVIHDGSPLLTNDPAAHPDSIGLPDGHPQLTAFLGVPLKHEGRTIGIIAVGNKEGGYSEEDVNLLSSLSVAVVQAFMRKRAERALRRSEELLRVAAMAAEIGMWHWTPGTNDVEVTANWRQLFGIQPDAQVTFETWRNALHPDDRDDAVKALNTASQQHREFNKEYRVVRPDGSVRWLVDRGRAWYDESGRPIGMAGVNVDITNRKRMEQSLRESEQKYRELFEKMHESLFVIETITDEGGRPKDWRYVEVNPQTERFMGMSHEQMIGQLYSEVVAHPDPAWIALLGNVALTGEPIAQEMYSRTRGRWLDIKAYSPRPGHTAVLFTDISDRKQAEEERERLLEELKRSNTELEQFAYVASHDLQEPLRMVSSYVQLLQQKYAGVLDAKADRYIHYAVDGAQRMQKLIEGLLAYSRISRRGAEFRPIDTNMVFSAAVSNLSVFIRENSATISRDDLPLVTGDETQLVQLLQNLISNAIKYKRPDRAPRVHISATHEGNEYIFSVRDNGIGIDTKYYDRIFQIFQRLHARTEYEGTGIGLALCKRIVERHHGRIWVESIPGEGSTFFFTISAVG